MNVEKLGLLKDPESGEEAKTRAGVVRGDCQGTGLLGNLGGQQTRDLKKNGVRLTIDLVIKK